MRLSDVTQIFLDLQDAIVNDPEVLFRDGHGAGLVLHSVKYETNVEADISNGLDKRFAEEKTQSLVITMVS